VPELVRSDLGRGAAAFSLVAAGYALGSIIAGIVLVRVAVRRKALGSILAWLAYLPGYALFAVAGSVGIAVAGAVLVGFGQGAAWVLVNSAAQEQIPDRLLGRVMGLIALVHRGAHATGLLLVAPLFAVAEPQVVFAAAALAIPATALAGVVIGGRRAAAAPAAA
jgi:MFS-type transporter involved in bile tolerance (Atg22 family)